MLLLRRRDALLKNQKPKNSRYQTSSRVMIRLLVGVGGVVIVGYALFVIQLRAESAQSPATLAWLPWIADAPTQVLPPRHSFADGSTAIVPKQAWQLVVTVAGEPPPPAVQTRIDDVCHKFLRTAHRDELQFIAEYLMRESAFDQVVLRRGQPNEVIVELSTPYPAALIQADTLRYVAETGIIFGQAHPAASDALTLFSGVFTEATTYHLSPANKLIVDGEVTAKIKLLLTALALAEGQELEPHSIHHHAYRGLVMVLRDRTEIILGHAPFAKKFARLQTVFYQAEASQQLIKKIDLDYKDKAFIQTASSELSSM